LYEITPSLAKKYTEIGRFLGSLSGGGKVSIRVMSKLLKNYVQISRINGVFKCRKGGGA